MVAVEKVAVHLKRCAAWSGLLAQLNLLDELRLSSRWLLLLGVVDCLLHFRVVIVGVILSAFES